ncbi:MAG: cob(I)yrinic acid a,c-diamide adenosyltransferase [Desulfuromonadaceae bacterium]|nr:cob(I)yrinic acid a,c-diamide adenosyltransferase [Desulfuromonadaceae bacterium]
MDAGIDKKRIVQVYTGEGKGKTTAALGLIVRALGQGFRVLLARFLKPAAAGSGELLFFRGIEGIDILSSGMGYLEGLNDWEGLRATVEKTYLEVQRSVLSGRYDLVVLDEINNAMHLGLVSVAEVIDLLDRRPQHTEMVLTGRNAPVEIIDKAELVTRMEKIKHVYENGIDARRGIEF